ncbi:MAG: hypothetical protein EOQ39_03645 [Mesorhizobium sp.]|uniref:hypothetical protein n=1 Tax=Mesorhizobium sp. TaxID=1871066 RepID=UPI000FE876A2|nr:hypothetical protein [Mesorhizobium sp.]RWB09004.1 MAG: hypothetical protein EOQ37_05800 [Mesorhizobium sp.]RWB17425.1 MAG: hypothetical protein EOQ39_03645 [Mesorhizobium sp.]
MVDRLTYTEFRDHFLLAIAIATKVNTNQMIDPLVVALGVQGRFQEGWPQTAMKDLADSDLISGTTFLSGDGSYKITGRGLERAENFAHSIGADLYKEIDGPEEDDVHPPSITVDAPDKESRIPEAAFVIAEPVSTRDTDQLKADLRSRLNLLEALLSSERSMMGHNQPPGAIEVFAFSDNERSELLGEIAALREQIEEPIPDLAIVSKVAGLFWRAASKAAAWIGERLNAQVDNAITLLPTVGLLGVVTYGRQLLDALHAAANAVLAWMHVLPQV